MITSEEDNCHVLVTAERDSAVHGIDALASDRDLLAIFVATRARWAVGVLVQRHGPMVAGVIRRLLHQQSDAEDAFQATFLILLQSASKIQKQASLAAWLYGVAYRTACRVRKRSTQQRVVAMLDLHIEPIQIDNPLEKIANESQLELLDRELHRLRPRLKESLIEHHLLGFTAPQIAERLNISVSAVEGRLRRGRALLRESLARRGISFSVVVAVASAYQQHCVAAVARSWTGNLLQSDLFSQSVSSTTLPSTDSSLLPLIQGELAMKSVFIKGASLVIAVTCLTLAISTIPLYSSSTGKAGNSMFSIANETAEDDFSLNTVAIIAKDKSTDSFGDKSTTVDSRSSIAEIEFKKDPPWDGRRTVLAQGMGGMGGGDAVDGKKGNETLTPRKTIPFKKPTGSPPNWITEGGTWAQEQDKIHDRIRSVLRKKVKPDFNNMPLRVVLESWAAELQLPILIDTIALEGAGGVTPEDPVTLTGVPEISLRSALRLVLEPLELTYVIEDEVMKITTKDQGSARIRRMYDLAYLFPSDERVTELFGVIQTTVPANWDVNGGEDSFSMIGSILVVNCPEDAQIAIEGLLSDLSRMNKENF